MISSISNFARSLNEIELNRIAQLEVEQLFSEVESSQLGLNTKKAQNRLHRFGPNQIRTAHQPSPILKLGHMVLSPLPVLLIILSLISYVTGEKTGSLVIAAMVFISIFLTFIQEYKSNKAAEKLKSLVATKANVIRDGNELELDLNKIVLGDVIHLSAGDIVPCDIRLFHTKDLFVNQASLTGESLPVEKMHSAQKGNQKTILDLNTICFMGSHVVSGSAKGIVISTGANTVFGKLAQEITQQTKNTSFDQGVQKYIWLMLRFMFVMAPIIFLTNGIIKGDWLEAALFAVALSVSLTPEMLPLLVTINLAKGALCMARQSVIVKRLNAIQNLGGMDILCVDKTGTLTQDNIILESHLDVNGKPDSRVLEFAYLNSHYQSGLKNLLDVAILKHHEIHKQLHSDDIYIKVDEIPFDFQRRRMSVVVERNSKDHILICKGAVEEIFSCCQYAQVGNQLINLDHTHLVALQKIVTNLNNDGFRIIAVAIKQTEAVTKSYTVADEVNLTLLGYIAFLDPPKDSAKPAIKDLIDCGVAVKILTGDNERITQKVCHEVGLAIQHIALGSDVEKMNDEQLAEFCPSITVFAKMTPHQKCRVIQALQQKGHVVGYLGDGINDGPSLKVADVSISVDTAVDIAKESADIILLKKDLQILYKGVLEGRRVFGNLMKYLKISSSSNLGNTLSMLGASAMLPFLPMAPVQILINDLLYDLSQSAVPTDHIDDDYLKSPKNWDMRGIAHYMFFIGPISSVFDYLLFAYMWFYLKANSLELESLFQTGWFVESLLSQTLIVHILRTGKLPFFQSMASPALLLTTVLVSLIGIALPYTFLGEMLKMHPLPLGYWLGLFILLVGYLLLTQVTKSYIIKRFGLI